MGSTVVMKQDPQQKKLAPAEQPTTLFRRQGKKPHPSNAIPRIHTSSEKPLNTKNTNLIVRLEVTRQRYGNPSVTRTRSNRAIGADPHSAASRVRPVRQFVRCRACRLCAAGRAGNDSGD